MNYQKGGSNHRSQSKNQHSYAVAETGIARERSTIDRPSRTITAIDASYIYPVLVDEVLPGDTHQVHCNIKAWLATPLKPFLDNLYLNTFFFFVPNRLVWENWTKFQGEKINPGDTDTFTVPQIEIAGGTTAGVNKLADFFGITTRATTYEVNAMPFRGYNLIYNEFFRDTNLQDSLVVDIDDANSDEADYVLKKRGKQKDYITGALPFPQRGDAVELPLGTSAPIVATGLDIVLEDQSSNRTTISSTVSIGLQNNISDPDILDNVEDLIFGAQDEVVVSLEADLTTATSITVNQLRESIAIQQILELDARGGTRHPEQLKARFGVTSADHRLQRPEYLGGGQVNISVNAVPATSKHTTTAIGELGAQGAGQGSGGGFTHSFVEHGFIIGLVSLRTDLTYSDGVPRFWNRETRFDYYEPSLAHLGEQEIFNREVFVSNDANDLQVWGYAERFGEYKYGNSMITGIMRPAYGPNIAFWHLGELFNSLPTLNDAFIQANPPMDRITAVVSEPDILMDVYFTNKCTRVMPVFNTPGLRRF